MSEFQVNLDSQDNIVLMRVDNGWIVRTEDRYMRGVATPLRVAETPAALTEIVREWAARQIKPAESK